MSTRTVSLEQLIEEAEETGLPFDEIYIEQVMEEPEELTISETQHCVLDESRCYGFSHTAGYCGRPQPRRCGCAFCYPEN